ncbi:Meiotically up-regulated gene 69 protein [Cytospora mali]|uniref:Meiotically up-regulated gene 69 protein n=2 Tax=Cytospora mali TaxID=578113 RepID=A0ACD6AYC0_CYTMA|nr:Meiotically up-regulated gene 69 protein [Valsa mali var. pyri (nom. inval.)]KUI64706.1 Meiotically up-regulated gene 69 protein [Valsa mali]
MAQKAKKDRAKSNLEALKSLHLGAAIVNGLFLLWHFFFKSRSLWAYVLLSAPSFFCQFALEKAGRPSYDPSTGALRNSGEDMSSPGLTEYMWDVIWVTWACQVLVMLFGNWFWIIWAVVPAYGAYKGYGLLGAARQMTGMQGQGPQGQDAAPVPGNRKQRRAAA